MKSITPIIKAEANKYVNEFTSKGYTKSESIKLALDKVKEMKKKDPLVALFWEIEHALIQMIDKK